AAAARPAKACSFRDRRAAVRFQCDLDTSCQPLQRIKSESWSAKVQDISKTGVRLTSKRRFERGTPLVVILRGHEHSITRTFLVRAVRVQCNSDKTWTIGC